MEGGFDFEKFSAELASKRFDSLWASGKSYLKVAKETFLYSLKVSINNYIKNITDRFSKCKSFFIRSDPVSLYDFYVPLGIASRKHRFETANFSSLTGVSNHSVIVGTAGSGKSMLMKHLLLDSIKEADRIPVFLELRDINNTGSALLDLLYSASDHFKLNIDRAHFEKAVEAGDFAIFLDGFDEVDHAFRKDVSRQVRELSKKNPNCIIVLSSRPDQEFFGWDQFIVFEAQPLSLVQACDLVDKLPYDSEVKIKFIMDLRSKLYENHKSFLSNPLLLSIMLLTYGHSADIPKKLSIFYNHAYEALFQRHDALKGGYQRDRLSDLDIQDFSRLFSAFCAQTYDKHLIQFTSRQAIGFIDKAKSLTNLVVSSQSFLADALQAVCLLVEDGLNITFPHRSFQEYFVANFIRDAKPEVQEKLLLKYAKIYSHDNIVQLLFEMDQQFVERVYLLPALQELAEFLDFKSKIGITQYVRYLKNEFTRFDLQGNKIYGYLKPAEEGKNTILWFSLFLKITKKNLDGMVLKK